MANEWNPDSVFDILADSRVRQILVTAYGGPCSVNDLAQCCDGSQSSIYRRINVLDTHNLLSEKTKIDPDGHHYSVYEPNFEKIEIEIDDNRVIVEVENSRCVEHYSE